MTVEMGISVLAFTWPILYLVMTVEGPDGGVCPNACYIFYYKALL